AGGARGCGGRGGARGGGGGGGGGRTGGRPAPPPAAPPAHPPRHYDRFWSNALRWLVRDPDLTSLQVTADPPSVEPGHSVGAVVTARQPDYQPAASAEVRVDLFSLAERKVLQSRTASAGPDGRAPAA